MKSGEIDLRCPGSGSGRSSGAGDSDAFNPAALLIEVAGREDIQWIAEFQVLMAQESEGMELQLPTVVAGVTHLFDHPELGHYLVARAPVSGGGSGPHSGPHSEPQSEGTVPIGCMLVQKEWSDWRNRLVLWIHSLYVVPELRQQGVFRRLYRHLKEKVQSDAELGGIRLYVDKRNTRAQRAYERAGMSNEHYELYEWMKT